MSSRRELTRKKTFIRMDFSAALALLKEGKKMTRAWWKNAVSVFLVPGSKFTVNREPLLSVLGEGTEVEYRPHIDMLASDGTVGTWAPSMHDVLAEDWEVKE